MFERSLGSANASKASGAHGGTYLSRRSQESQSELEAAAKRDGATGLPGQYDTTLAQYEQQVCQQARHWITNTAGDFRKRDAVAYPRFAKARKDFRDALGQYEEKKKELGNRPVNIQMESRVYWPLMLFMALCEGGVNMIAFEALFPDSRLVAIMAAAVLAVVLVFASHSVGAAIQQGKNLRWAAVTTIFSVAMTFLLAYLRYVYVGFENASGVGELTSRPKWNADMITGFFLVFNLLFFVIAAWLGAKLHDEDATYEQRFKTYLKMRELLVREKQLRDGSQWEGLRVARDEEGLHRKLIAQYRDLNMHSREIKATPRVWVENPPEKLIQVDGAAFALADNECRFEAELEQS